MAFADASTTRLAWVVESTEGTTPATPGFQELRFAGETLSRNVQHETSNEIRDDRNVTDHILVAEGAGGGINGELSYGTWEPFMESVLGGAFSSDVLKNGTARKAFTFEKTLYAGATPNYLRYLGMMANTMEISVQARQIATIAFEFMGRGGASAASAISGATYTAPNTKKVANASSHVSNLTLSNVSGTPRVSSINLRVNANLRQQPEIGALAVAGVGLGQLQVSGSLEAYFETLDINDAVFAETVAGLAFTVGNVANEKYTFAVPSLKLSNPRQTAGGNNQDVMVQVDFMGIYNASDAATMKITRAVA